MNQIYYGAAVACVGAGHLLCLAHCLEKMHRTWSEQQHFYQQIYSSPIPREIREFIWNIQVWRGCGVEVSVSFNIELELTPSACIFADFPRAVVFKSAAMASGSGFACLSSGRLQLSARDHGATGGGS